MSPSESSDIIESILQHNRTVYRALQHLTAPDWLDLNLSMAQLKALFVIARGDSMTVGQVAEALEIGLPTASHLVDKLVQAALILRENDPADRRRTVLSLSEEGQRITTRLRQGGPEHMRRWLSQLNDDELAALLVGISALARIAAPDTASVTEPTP